MKKIMLFPLFFIVFVAASCDIGFADQQTAYTESQIRQMIDAALDERTEGNLLQLSEEELLTLIETLMPEHLSEEAVEALVQSYVGTDLTISELTTLIEGLLPEDRYQTTYDLESFAALATAMIADRLETVIGIQTLSSSGIGWGSGVIYKKVNDNYYVITNHHVIDTAASLEIYYDRHGILHTIAHADITVIGSDPVTDIAVLRFASETVFPVVTFGDSSGLSPGQFVFAVGHPLGVKYFATVTMGILSSSTRFLQAEDFNATVLQHDAALSPGNSGGALFDINGTLIGINHMKIIDTAATNIGFAVPVATVVRVILDLEEHGVVIRPYLGITASVYVNVCGHHIGVCVTGVSSGTAAAAAGLNTGDVILGFKHESADDFLDIFNFNDLREAVLNSRVNDDIVIRYWRNGQIYESAVATLTRHPDD